MPAVLFVCLGNICRSPAAEAILHFYAKRNYPEDYTHVKSCGLADWHLGELPDPRMQKALKKKGFKSYTRAEQFKPLFFDSFDYILASDLDIMKKLLEFAKSKQNREKVSLMTEFSPELEGKDIPDPYYGKEKDFDEVVSILETVCQDILHYIFKKQ